MGLDEAQLINPQGTNKNMASKYWEILKDEWLRYGGNVVSKGDVTIIKGDNEWLIHYKHIILHIVPGKMIAARVHGKWYVSRAPNFRGNAISIARALRHKIPMVPIP